MENATRKLENKSKEDKHEVDIYNAETQRIRALSDHEVDANQMEMNAIAKILEGSKAIDEHDLRSEEAERNEEMTREQRQHQKGITVMSRNTNSTTKGKSTEPKEQQSK